MAPRRGGDSGGPLAIPRKGREAFVRFECYSCHEVQGEQFPALGTRETLGPELSRMGPLHEPEYFVEAIVNPSAVIESGKGYEAADGSSKMPSYSDSMTVQEFIDLVTYLRALPPPAPRRQRRKAVVRMTRIIETCQGRVLRTMDELRRMR
jgi:hypothetical protein